MKKMQILKYTNSIFHIFCELFKINFIHSASSIKRNQNSMNVLPCSHANPIACISVLSLSVHT